MQDLLVLSLRNRRFSEPAKVKCHEAADRPVGKMLPEGVRLGLIVPVPCEPLPLARPMRYVSPCHSWRGTA